MKKIYSKPSMTPILLEPSKILEGSKVYTDDPQDVGSALSRRHQFIEDD